MFHRRLLLLMVLMLVGGAVLSFQLARLAILEGAVHQKNAERVLRRSTVIPTVRGTIYDRKGRPLAVDEPCADIAVDYQVITGEWVVTQARRRAYREYRGDWHSYSFDQRWARIEEFKPEYQQQVDQLWQAIMLQCDLSQKELDDRIRTIVQRVQAIRADVWERKSLSSQFEGDQDVRLGEVVVTVAEEKQSHTIVPAVSDEVAFFFRKAADDLPGVTVIESKRRMYPFESAVVDLDRMSLPSPLKHRDPMTMTVEGVAVHLLGQMRDVWAEDVQQRPYRLADGVDRGGYLPGDRVGVRGVEQTREDVLRGIRGRLVRQVDTGEESMETPVSGQDVTLTIDIALQARIQALMDPEFGLLQVQPWHSNNDSELGTPLTGSAVVMDARNGELLALVTTPSFSREQLRKDARTIVEDFDQPMANRPIGAIYPPGSTIKPIIYAIAASKGVIQTHEVITCNGHYHPDRPNQLRCWGWRPNLGMFHRHGPQRPSEAIANSCNIYFYACGQKLGPQRLIPALHEWGFGQSFDIGLPDEVAGIMPRLEGHNAPGRAPTTDNAILMGIGQGPIAISPLQITTAHAALARGGRFLPPTLIRSDQRTPSYRDLGVSSAIIQEALTGMYDSANATNGTSSHLRLDGAREPIINLSGVEIRAKTGTAQAPVIWDDINKNGRIDEGERVIRRGNHGWYVAHVVPAGSTEARYIVTVTVEYGGSGGRVAGPVANQILHALHQEGYLD